MFLFSTDVLEQPVVRNRSFILFALLLIAQAACCTRSHEKIRETTSRSQTIGNLQKWAGVLVCIIRNRLDDPSKYADISDAIAAWRDGNFIDASIVPYLQRDAWGQFFSWKVTQKNNCLEIEVISNGEDGIYQEGNGDDLVLTVIATSTGSISLRSNYLPSPMMDYP